MYEMRGYIGVIKDNSTIMFPLNRGFFVNGWDEITPFMKKIRVSHYIITLDEIKKEE